MRAIKTSVISILAIGLLAGSAVGVAAQDETTDPMAPSAYSEPGGEWQPRLSTDPATGLDLATAEVQATDPRAAGTWTQIEDAASVEYGGLHYQAGSESVRLVNDGGAWVGTRRYVKTRDGDGAISGSFVELVGEDGYEGLSLLIFGTVGYEGDSVSHSFIVPTGIVPAMPPPPAAE